MTERKVKTLITGGCRSGKSRYALERFSESPGRKLFVATAEANDAEMTERIRLHREHRGPGWDTVEEPLDPAAVIAAEGSTASVMVLDCLTLWISNLMMRGVPEKEILQRAEDLMQAVRHAPCPVAVITNEVGFGIVPDNELARQFRDLSGHINQRFSERFDEVVLMVSGLPLMVKQLPPSQLVEGERKIPFSFPTAEKKGVYEAIYLRRDMRHFLPDPLEPEVVGRILHAAHHAG